MKFLKNAKILYLYLYLYLDYNFSNILRSIELILCFYAFLPKKFPFHIGRLHYGIIRREKF